MKANIISILFLALCAIAQDSVNTCILRQNCIRTPEQEAANVPCPNPMNVEPPSPDPYPPAPMAAEGINNLAAACPFYDPTTPLCCGADTAAVMAANF